MFIWQIVSISFYKIFRASKTNILTRFHCAIFHSPLHRLIFFQNYSPRCFQNSPCSTGDFLHNLYPKLTPPQKQKTPPLFRFISLTSNLQPRVITTTTTQQPSSSAAYHWWDCRQCRALFASDRRKHRARQFCWCCCCWWWGKQDSSSNKMSFILFCFSRLRMWVLHFLFDDQMGDFTGNRCRFRCCVFVKSFALMNIRDGQLLVFLWQRRKNL